MYMGVIPFLGDFPLLGFIVDTLLFLTLVAGARNAAAGKLVKISLVVMGAGILGSSFLRAEDPVGPVAVASLGLQSLALFIITLSILKDVLIGGEIDGNRVMGSACIYLLFGIIWTGLYTMVEIVNPGSFSLSGHTTETMRFDLWYFSMVTLTTLGYGDIAPLAPVAKSLAVVEAVTGQLILVILVARTVGLHTSLFPGKKS